MHAQLIVSLCVFVSVLSLLGGITVLIRLFVRTGRKRFLNDPSDSLRKLDSSAARDEFEHRAVEQPPLMPPPLPMDEFEFYQAGQYAMDQNLPPLPSPPPQGERDDW